MAIGEQTLVDFSNKTTNINVILRHALQIAKKMTAEGPMGGGGANTPKSTTGSDVINVTFRVSMESEFYKFVIICC